MNPKGRVEKIIAEERKPAPGTEGEKKGIHQEEWEKRKKKKKKTVGDSSTSDSKSRGEGKQKKKKQGGEGIIKSMSPKRKRVHHVSRTSQVDPEKKLGKKEGE